MKNTPCILLIIAFLANIFGPLPIAGAQEFHLPIPGVMVHLSPSIDPPLLKGIKVHANDPFRFEFILDQGDLSNGPGHSLKSDQVRSEATKLIKYFLASLTIPEKDLWVNLSPYEKDRIIPPSFGLTEMGRDLLAEDYMLKQITASLIYPEGETGRRFWKRVYEEAEKKFGTTNIPVNTFNKVWIVPEKAVVYENARAGTAYIVESRLKVMLEQDYLAFESNSNGPSNGPGHSLKSDQVRLIGSQIVREIVIPELTREVNEGKNFAQLRQVYNSLILAAWYKKKIRDSILGQVYADKKKVAGVGYATQGGKPNDVELIYRRYIQAFKKGVFNYIKEEADPVTRGTLPRKYFSGGVDFAMGSTNMKGINGVIEISNAPSTLRRILNIINPTRLFIVQGTIETSQQPLSFLPVNVPQGYKTMGGPGNSELAARFQRTIGLTTALLGPEVYSPLQDNGLILEFMDIISSYIKKLDPSTIKDNVMRVLEIGSGTGLGSMTAFHQAKQRGFQVKIDAVDINDGPVENTKKNLELLNEITGKDSVRVFRVPGDGKLDGLNDRYDLILFYAPDAVPKEQLHRADVSIRMDQDIFKRILQNIADRLLARKGMAIIGVQRDVLKAMLPENLSWEPSETSDAGVYLARRSRGFFKLTLSDQAAEDRAMLAENPLIALNQYDGQLKDFVIDLLNERYAYWGLPHGLAGRIINTLLEDPLNLKEARARVYQDVIDFGRSQQWQEAYDRYKEAVKYESTYNLILPRIGQLRPGSTILDWGAGNNDLGNTIVNKLPGIKVIGIDVMEYGYQKTGVNLEYRHEIDPTKAPGIADHSIDVVTMNAVFHHIDDQLAPLVLKEIHRILKPDGRLILIEDTYSTKLEPGSDPQEVDLKDTRTFLDLVRKYGDRFGRDYLAFNDWYSNIVVHSWDGMALPYKFRSIEEWQRFLASSGFSSSYVRHIGFPAQGFHKPDTGILEFTQHQSSGDMAALKFRMIHKAPVLGKLSDKDLQDLIHMVQAKSEIIKEAWQNIRHSHEVLRSVDAEITDGEQSRVWSVYLSKGKIRLGPQSGPAYMVFEFMNNPFPRIHWTHPKPGEFYSDPKAEPVVWRYIDLTKFHPSRVFVKGSFLDRQEVEQALKECGLDIPVVSIEKAQVLADALYHTRPLSLPNIVDTRALNSRGEIFYSVEEMLQGKFHDKKLGKVLPEDLIQADHVFRDMEALLTAPYRDHAQLVQEGQVKKILGLAQPALNGHPFSDFVGWMNSVSDATTGPLSEGQLNSLAGQLNVKGSADLRSRAVYLAQASSAFYKHLPKDGKINIYLFRDAFGLYLADRSAGGDPLAMMVSKALVQKVSGTSIDLIVLGIINQAKSDLHLDINGPVPEQDFDGFKNEFFRLFDDLINGKDVSGVGKDNRFIVDRRNSLRSITDYLSAYAAKTGVTADLIRNNGVRFIDTTMRGTFVLLMEAVAREMMRKAGASAAEMEGKTDGRMFYSSLSQSMSFLDLKASQAAARMTELNDYPVELNRIVDTADAQPKVQVRPLEVNNFVLSITAFKNELLNVNLTDQQAQAAIKRPVNGAVDVSGVKDWVFNGKLEDIQPVIARYRDLFAEGQPMIERIEELKDKVVIRLKDGRVIFIADHHNHALSFWWLMMKEGRLKVSGNRILHIDAHADAHVNARNWDNNRLEVEKAFDPNSNDLSAVDRLSVKLGIEGFIAPLAESGFISDWHWLYNLHGGMAARMERKAAIKYGIGDGRTSPEALDFDILDVDIDVLAQGFSEEEAQPYLKSFAELAKKAKVISIVTSPDFIDQFQALRYIKTLVADIIAQDSPKDTGGIDLAAANMDLQIQNAGEAIRFHIDPSMLQRLQNAPGFVPVIISVKPLGDLQRFLGL